jgi:hypothetical protein
MTANPLPPPTWHKHPISGLPLYGIRLPSDTVLEALDHYDCPAGHWQLCPAQVLGTAAVSKCTWVRPVAPLTNDEVIEVRDGLLAIPEPNVSQLNILRDCDIALGLVRCRPETCLRACARVYRATRTTNPSTGATL